MNQIASTPRPAYSAGQPQGDEAGCTRDQKELSLRKTWVKWLAIKTRELISGDRLRKDLGRMTERDLMDIGLIRSDIHRITRGMMRPLQ